MSSSFAPDATMAQTDAPLRLTIADPRADDCHREVLLSPHRVTIERQYCGIAMRVSVPVNAYRGVSVGLNSSGSGDVTYELRLAHQDDDLSIPLGIAPDDLEIWADWRSWARFFGLPALVERSDGLVEWTAAPSARSDVRRPAPAKRRVRRRRAAFIHRRYAHRGAAAIVYRKAEIIAPD